MKLRSQFQLDVLELPACASDYIIIPGRLIYKTNLKG